MIADRSSIISRSNIPDRICTRISGSIISLVLTLSSVLSVRLVYPEDYEKIDSVRVRIADAHFDTTRALADTLTEDFFILIDFYNQHMVDNHNQVKLSFYPSHINPDTMSLPDNQIP